MCRVSILVLAMVGLLVAPVMASSVAEKGRRRERRSDDGGPLEAVVEQLSQQVTLLSAQLSAATGRISKLETKTATLETSVAFFAWNSGGDPIQVGPGAAIVLNRVSPNIGNAYDTDTGVFTAPHSGLYAFQASFMSNVDTDSKVFVYLYVDHNIVVRGVADSRHGYWDQTTLTTTVHLTAGQKVTMKNAENRTTKYFSFVYTNFSGYLLKAD